MEKKTLGNMIAELRKEKGMTQADLAEKMGITDKAVSKWERDLSYPDITTIPKLADILGVSADELLKCRTESKETDKKENLTGKIEIKSGFTLLGIGLACLAISLFIDQKD